jgi:hypothetical protein
LRFKADPNLWIRVTAPVCAVARPIELRDIGRDQGGVSAAQLMAEIAQRLNAEVERAIADSEEFQSLLGDVAKRRAREEVERTLERELGTDNASKFKGLLDQF